jgi:hypothetical protein
MYGEKSRLHGPAEPVQAPEILRPQSWVRWSNLLVHNSPGQLRRTMEEFSD